jgi:hypothetical protein
MEGCVLHSGSGLPRSSLRRGMLLGVNLAVDPLPFQGFCSGLTLMPYRVE